MPITFFPNDNNHNGLIKWKTRYITCNNFACSLFTFFGNDFWSELVIVIVNGVVLVVGSGRGSGNGSGSGSGSGSGNGNGNGSGSRVYSNWYSS